MKKEDWSLFNQNPTVVLGFDLNRPVGKVTKVFENGLEVDIVGKGPVQLKFGDIELGIVEGTNKIIEVSITSEAYAKLMKVWP